METISAISQIDRQIEQHPGRKRRSGRSTPKCARGFDPNGFLKMAFLPLYKSPVHGITNTEKQFFQSAKAVCREYGWRMPKRPHLPFPHNIASSYERISDQISEAGLTSILAHDDNNETCIVTVEEYNTKFDLYFIPLRPIYNILKDDKNKNIRPAVLEISRYLCHNAGFAGLINGSFAWNEYERLEEWAGEQLDNLEEGEDEDCWHEQIIAVKQVQTFASSIYPDMNVPFSSKRIKSAIGKIEIEEQSPMELKTICNGFIELAEKFPQHSLYTNIPSEYFDRYDYYELVRLEQWACFFWSDNHFLFEHFMECVEADLQEKPTKEVPLKIRVFNAANEIPVTSFDFEDQLLDLVHQFTCFLNDYDYEI
ncbi:MAG: hypothetical protein J7502_04710 [Flavisolibacter sp.]|nr:hypothetical protein [Flavisolibacter sp.]